MEIWDVYDDKGIKSGKTIIKGTELKTGEYHLVVHIWIVNSNGEFLIQKRASTVRFNPNKWSLTSGSAISGEDSYGACIREVIEEIGIEPNMDNALKLFTLKRRTNYCDVWLVKQNINLQQCILQKSEVDEIKWANMNEINEMINNGMFIKYSYLQQFFERVKTGINEKHTEIIDDYKWKH